MSFDPSQVEKLAKQYVKSEPSNKQEIRSVVLSLGEEANRFFERWVILLFVLGVGK